MYSGSVASTGTHSAGCAPAMSSDQSASRPGTIGARSCGRWRMMQRLGLAVASSIALSRSGFYGAAARHVPVEGVVARVDDATREPAIVRRPRSVEHLIPAPVPVDAVGGLRPEPLGLGAPPRIHLVLRAGHRSQAPGRCCLTNGA